MFVRIQHTESGTSTLYQCGKADLIPHEERHKVLVQLEGVPEMGDVGSIVHKARENVYFMNDQGQTIDSYRWPVQDTGRTGKKGNDLFTGDSVSALIHNPVGDTATWHLGVIKKGQEGYIIDIDILAEDKPLESFATEEIRRV